MSIDASGPPDLPIPKTKYRANGTVSVLLTRQELADALGVSIKTIDAWRRQGGGALPVATMIGRLVRFDIEHVRTWLANRKSASTSDRKGC